MHNQQNHNHQEHHHAEGGCGCNHSHSKTQHGCSSEPKNAAAQAEHAHHHHDHGDSGCCTAAPDDPDEESDRLAAAPSGSQRFSWKVTGMDCPSCAKKIENAVTALPGVDSARVLFATEKLVVDAQSDISLRIQTRSPKPALPCSALRPPKPPRRKPHASANSHRCCC